MVGAGSIISAASGAQLRDELQRRRRRRRDRGGQRADAGCPVGRGAVVRHAILIKNVVVGPGEMVGVDLEKDRERFAISAGGVVAVRQGRLGSSRFSASVSCFDLSSPSPQQLDERPYQYRDHNQHEHREQRWPRNTSPMLMPSSTVDSTGAATPAVATLAAGRTADLVSDTNSATRTPITIGIH